MKQYTHIGIVCVVLWSTYVGISTACPAGGPKKQPPPSPPPIFRLPKQRCVVQCGVENVFVAEVRLIWC